MRANVIAVTQPIYPEKERIKPCKTVSFNNLRKKEDNPYEIILAREVKNWFENSQLVAVLHINPISGENFFDARVEFHKNGMQLKKYGSGILNRAIINTKFEALAMLNGGSTHCTGFIFSPDHKKVSQIMKILKKFPQMHLMCGVVDGRLLSKNELTDYAKMPNIDIVRSQFCHVLNMAAGQIVQNLSAHQSNLVNILDAHVKVNDLPPKDTTPTIETTENKVHDPEKS